MAAYFVIQLKINDPEGYAEYGKRFLELLPQVANLRFLAIDDDPRVIEGAWDCNRTILAEFPSTAEAMDFYESDAYQQLCEFRWAACETNWVMLEGLGNPNSS